MESAVHARVLQMWWTWLRGTRRGEDWENWLWTLTIDESGFGKFQA
jgi:hypothetical protein